MTPPRPASPADHVYQAHLFGLIPLDYWRWSFDRKPGVRPWARPFLWYRRVPRRRGRDLYTR